MNSVWDVNFCGAECNVRFVTVIVGLRDLIICDDAFPVSLYVPTDRVLNSSIHQLRGGIVSLSTGPTSVQISYLLSRLGSAHERNSSCTQHRLPQPNDHTRVDARPF